MPREENQLKAGSSGGIENNPLPFRKRERGRVGLGRNHRRQISQRVGWKPLWKRGRRYLVHPLEIAFLFSGRLPILVSVEIHDERRSPALAQDQGRPIATKHLGIKEVKVIYRPARNSVGLFAKVCPKGKKRKPLTNQRVVRSPLVWFVTFPILYFHLVLDVHQRVRTN